MKTLNTINSSIKKFAKGMFAIFTIKLLLFGGTFLIQSCQNDGNIFVESEQELALISFENLISKATSNIQLSIENDRKSKIEPKNKSYARGIEEISNIQYAEILSEPNIKESIKHLTTGSIELFSSYGITENDLKENRIELVSPEIIEYGILMFAAAKELEEDRANELTTNLYAMFFSPLYASRIGECAGDALGISAIAAVLREGLKTKAAKKLLFKAIRKVATRTLGWVGAGIFAYEFGDCMDWWISGGSRGANITDCNDLVKVSTRDYTDIKYVYIFISAYIKLL